jgi:hypothetical protein
MAGKITKTGATDAKLLALFAQKMEPEAGCVPDKDHEKLKEMIARRRQLVDLVAQERNQLRWQNLCPRGALHGGYRRDPPQSGHEGFLPAPGGERKTQETCYCRRHAQTRHRRQSDY